MRPAPVEPPAATLRFPDPRRVQHEVITVGGDLEPGTLLAAYRAGIFPWPRAPKEARGATRRTAAETLVWCSPDPRAVYSLDLRAPAPGRSYEVTFDETFTSSMLACSSDRAEGTWITAEIIEAYGRLHALGWAHSVEVRQKQELVAGLCGVAIGASFSIDSTHGPRPLVAHALAVLAARMGRAGYTLLDGQIMSPGAAAFGCADVPRADFLDQLERAIATRPVEPMHAWDPRLR